MRCYQVWYHATVVDTLQDEGDCLVSFTYYLNEAVVGREEMVELESIGEIPRGEEVDVEALELLELLPSQDLVPVKVVGGGLNVEGFMKTRPGAEAVTLNRRL